MAARSLLSGGSLDGRSLAVGSVAVGSVAVGSRAVGSRAVGSREVSGERGKRMRGDLAEMSDAGRSDTSPEVAAGFDLTDRQSAARDAARESVLS